MSETEPSSFLPLCKTVLENELKNPLQIYDNPEIVGDNKIVLRPLKEATSVDNVTLEIDDEKKIVSLKREGNWQNTTEEHFDQLLEFTNRFNEYMTFSWLEIEEEPIYEYRTTQGVYTMKTRPVFRSSGYYIGSDTPLLLIKSFATATCTITKKVWEYLNSGDYEDWRAAADSLIEAFEPAASQQQLLIKMSVYGGFATRALEMNYGRVVESLIFTLQKRVVSALKQELVDDKSFIQQFRDIWKQLGVLESQKFLPPKFSVMWIGLATHLGEDPHDPRAKQQRSGPKIGTNSSKRSLSSTNSAIPENEEKKSNRSVPSQRKKGKPPIPNRTATRSVDTNSISSASPPRSEVDDRRCSTSQKQRQPKLRAYYDRLFENQFLTKAGAIQPSSTSYSFEAKLNPIRETPTISPRRNESRSTSRQSNKIMDRKIMDLSKPVRIGYRTFVPR